MTRVGITCLYRCHTDNVETFISTYLIFNTTQINEKLKELTNRLPIMTAIMDFISERLGNKLLL